MTDRVKFRWTGYDDLLTAELRHGGKTFSATFKNDRNTCAELIEMFQALEEKLKDAFPEEHASSTSSPAEVQREAGAEEEAGTA